MFHWQQDGDQWEAEVPTEIGSRFVISPVEGGYSLALYRYCSREDVASGENFTFSALSFAKKAALRHAENEDFPCAGCSLQGFDLDENWNCMACAVGMEQGDDAKYAYIAEENASLERWHADRMAAIA